MNKTTQKLLAASEQLTPAPEPQVRQLMDTDLMARVYGVELSDYPNDLLWLATWANGRTGWYAEEKNPDSPECAFWCTVLNDSECFATRSLCEQWLHDKMEAL